MTSLDELHATDAPYTSFEWETNEKSWDDFIQQTEGYYRKGYGLVNQNQVYADEYAVHNDYRTFARRLGFDIDDLPPDTFVFAIQSGVLEIYRPMLTNAVPKNVVHVAEFAVSLGMANNDYIRWDVDEEDRWQRTRIKTLKNNAGIFDF